MVVKLKQTDKTVEVNASYGIRLIAQGKAAAVPQPKAKKGAPRKETGAKASADATEITGGDS